MSSSPDDLMMRVTEARQTLLLLIDARLDEATWGNIESRIENLRTALDALDIDAIGLATVDLQRVLSTQSGPGLMCDRCGASNDPARKFCTRCGESLMEAQYREHPPSGVTAWFARMRAKRTRQRQAREEQRRRRDPGYKAAKSRVRLNDGQSRRVPAQGARRDQINQLVQQIDLRWDAHVKRYEKEG